MASAVWQIFHGKSHDLAAPICMICRACKGSQRIVVKEISNLHFSHQRTAVIQEWYSGALVQHGADILDAVLPVVETSQPKGNTPKVMMEYVALAIQTLHGAARLAVL